MRRATLKPGIWNWNLELESGTGIWNWNLEPESQSPKSRIWNPETGLLILRMMKEIIHFSNTQ